MLGRLKTWMLILCEMRLNHCQPIQGVAGACDLGNETMHLLQGVSDELHGLVEATVHTIFLLTSQNRSRAGRVLHRLETLNRSSERSPLACIAHVTGAGKVLEFAAPAINYHDHQPP